MTTEQIRAEREQLNNELDSIGYALEDRETPEYDRRGMVKRKIEIRNRLQTLKTMETNLLFRPTTPGQIYELHMIGKLLPDDKPKAIKIIEEHLAILDKSLAQCEQWQAEDIAIERTKYVNLLERLQGLPTKNNQKRFEYLTIADANWKDAATAESIDDQLVCLNRACTYAMKAGERPIDWLFEKVKTALVA